jgi:perosamine synthetase
MHNSICKYNSTLREVLEAINNDPAGIAFITDDDNKLCGIVTDGDFRRLLLAGKSLDERFSKDLLGDYIFAKQGEEIESLIKRTNKKVRVIPIVNEKHELVDYFRYEHRVHMTPVAQPDLGGNELKYVTDAVLSTWISSTGKYIDEFESGFAKFSGCKYGVATSNGTVALHLALLAIGIEPGDEVIVPDLTFAATANAVLYCNATPVIVDIDPESWCIDPKEIEKAITPKTKAIIPVHLYGQPCDMAAIMAIAKKHNLKVIEDCAEAHGATFEGQVVGSFGDIACYSFFGNKILTTGEGGMCITNSEKYNDHMRTLRDHGMNKKKRYWHDMLGYNYRMTNLQAALGVAQLERISELIDQRKLVEKQYQEILKDFAFIKWQKKLNKREKVTWLVCAWLPEGGRELLFEQLKNNGIDIRPFFYPLSDMPIYKPYVFSNKESKYISERGLNLPTIKLIDFDKVRKAFQNFKELVKV